MSVEAIVFDFDGVIVDTEPPDFEPWRDCVRERGLDLTPELWVKRVGAAAYDLHFSPERHYEQLTGLSLDAAVLEYQRSMYLARCRQQTIMPGVLELIHYAREQGIALAIASNSYREWVEEFAQRVGVWDYFTCVSTVGEVANGKPAPDLYLNAVACLEVPAERCLAIEDSPTGMSAALAAGLRVVAVLTALTAPLDRPAAVALTLNSLSALSPEALLARF